MKFPTFLRLFVKRAFDKNKNNLINFFSQENKKQENKWAYSRSQLKISGGQLQLDI